MTRYWVNEIQPMDVRQVLNQVNLKFIVAVLLLSAGVQVNVDADDDLFQKRVAPILASHCATCHNHEESKGDFSVEDSQSFFEGEYVEAGNSASSHLVDLITPSGPGERPEMPKNGPSLDRNQVEVIKQWIDAGAKWPDGFSVEPDQRKSFDWWSLQPIQKPAVPQFDDGRAGEWVRTPIDAFVLRKLREHKLSPSGEADRRTLIRRLSFDLTGLPPTFAEIEEFENDSSADAYEKLVDRLLASPRYGERWARHWLDVVKYADTCGYDKDKLRPNAWPYRDYVIRSLNEDKPYKQFVEEQIAGDVLYPDTADGILALGFIAAGPWDFIGHVEVPESKIDGKVARNLDRDDMVSNTLNTFCSVTIQCARCHDHKFDPFTQEHYYSLQAVFAAVDRADRPYDDDPQIATQRKSIRQRIREIESQHIAFERTIAQKGGENLKQLNQKIDQARQTNKRPEFGYHSQIASSKDVEKWVEVEFPEPTSFSKLILRPCHDEFAGIGAGFGFPVRFRVEVDGKTVFDQTKTEFENPKLNPVEIDVSATAEKVRVVATKLAERSKDYILALAEIQVLDQQGQNVAGEATVNAIDSIEAPVRWQKSNLIDGIWYEEKTDSIRLQQLTEERESLIQKLVGQKVLAQNAELSKQLSAAKMELGKLPPGKMVYAAATNFRPQGNFKPTAGKPRKIRLLHRGDIQSPGETLVPGVLPLAEEALWKIELAESAPESERRSALARWLTRDDHPLTWRSIVNRVWHYHFGRGIVDTPNDFGRMGGKPTHAELLDWLAIEFRDGGGSLKDLHRLIVTSSVYRQSSNVQVAPTSSQQSTSDHELVPAPSEVDSGNRLYWRMNRRRLSAEEIRDAILLASGQLNLKMGGPGYFLFDLEKTEHSPHYEYHKFDHNDSNSYRRSIYRFIVRSQPDPYMTTLDCADSSQSTPARNETQTPLQSLTMLNSRFNLTMARKFADRLRAESNSLDAQIELAMRLSIGRSPTENEQQLIADYVQQHGLENLARIIFNLSEFMYVD